MKIRFRAKLKRTPDFRPTTLFIPKKLKDALKETFDADSDQVLLLGISLMALGDIDIKKSKDINIEEALLKYVDDEYKE